MDGVMEKPLRYILSGKATFTLIDRRPGREGGGYSRYTYKVNRPKKSMPHFVKLLTGPNNEQDYTFIGTIFDETAWRKKVDSPGSRLFSELWSWLQSGMWPDWLEIRHNGKCGKCGRALTVPESIEVGIGPECLKSFN